MHTSKPLYQANDIPAMQNKLYLSKHEALCAPSASLNLIQDESGLVYNASFKPDLVQYDDTYQNDQGFSLRFQQHLEYVSELCSQFIFSNDDKIVDVGCGKGGFVEALRRKGLNAIGYDNAYQGDSPYINKSFFGPKSHDKGKLLTLRHVLEHIQSPWKFIDRIVEANESKGFMYIEVPDLDWILENRAYFDIFHEHVNYFRSEDFSRRFGNAVLVNEKSFDGQYLSIVIDLSRITTCSMPPGFYKSGGNLMNSFDVLSQYERQLYLSLGNCEKIVIWGAGAKGVVFAARAPLKISQKISYGIDINPAKQGFFMPLSGVKVLDPASGLSDLDQDSHVVIMNPIYEKEIRESLPPDQSIFVLHS